MADQQAGPREPAEGLRLPGAASETPLLVITGMSGAGRSTAAKVLEDHGWYVVDNLPPQLLPQLRAMRRHADGEGHPEGPGPQLPSGVSGGMPHRLAVVIDSRARLVSGDGFPILDALTAGPDRPVLVFLDATDEALVRRFESVRRPHPLQGNGRLLDAITAERALMADLRSEADLIIDTSGLNVHQLTAKVASLLGASQSSRLRVAVMSFGFKYGVPLDADFVADMRFLPNPFWIPELRALSGLDEAVAAYVLDQTGAREFLDRMAAMFEPVVDGYAREGRRYVTIGIGCTGGKHRSVAMTEALAARLTGDRVQCFVVHRDLGRE